MEPAKPEAKTPTESKNEDAKEEAEEENLDAEDSDDDDDLAFKRTNTEIKKVTKPSSNKAVSFLQLRTEPMGNQSQVCNAIVDETKLGKVCQGAECTFDECCDCQKPKPKCVKSSWAIQCTAGCHKTPTPDAPAKRYRRAHTMFLLQLQNTKSEGKCGKIKSDEHINEHECASEGGCTFDDCCEKEEVPQTCARESKKWKSLCGLECPDNVHECAFVTEDKKLNARCKDNVCSFAECCKTTNAVDMPCRFSADLKFGFDSDVLAPENDEILNLYVCFLRKNPTATIMIQGHTDSKGSWNYNFKLGLRRAIAVYTRVREIAGKDPSIMKRIEDPQQCSPTSEDLRTCKYTRGENDPVNANHRVINGNSVDNPAGRAVNRRVDLIRTDAKCKKGQCPGVVVAHGAHPGEKTKDFAPNSLRRKCEGVGCTFQSRKQSSKKLGEILTLLKKECPVLPHVPVPSVPRRRRANTFLLEVDSKEIGQPGKACMYEIVGVCGPTSSCTDGVLQTGYCKGGSDNICCRPRFTAAASCMKK